MWKHFELHDNEHNSIFVSISFFLHNQTFNQHCFSLITPTIGPCDAKRFWRDPYFLSQPDDNFLSICQFCLERNFTAGWIYVKIRNLVTSTRQVGNVHMPDLAYTLAYTILYLAKGICQTEGAGGQNGIYCTVMKYKISWRFKPIFCRLMIQLCCKLWYCKVTWVALKAVSVLSQLSEASRVSTISTVKMWELCNIWLPILGIVVLT